MRYDAILLDADDTLFDFQAAEKNALKEILESLKLTDPEAPAVYHECNRACWKDFEDGKITQKALRTRRFADFFRHYGIEEDAQAYGQRFAEALSRQSILLPGALETVRAIAERLPVAIVTNGIAFVQHGRMEKSPVKEYISALIISEELGCQKPDPRMIFEALKALGGIAPERALMVGDSINSDIRCANNANVDACWFNPKAKELPEGVRVEYDVRTLDEIREIALAE